MKYHSNVENKNKTLMSKITNIGKNSCSYLASNNQEKKNFILKISNVNMLFVASSIEICICIKSDPNTSEGILSEACAKQNKESKRDKNKKSFINETTNPWSVLK